MGISQTLKVPNFPSPGFTLSCCLFLSGVPPRQYHWMPGFPACMICSGRVFSPAYVLKGRHPVTGFVDHPGGKLECKDYAKVKLLSLALFFFNIPVDPLFCVLGFECTTVKPSVSSGCNTGSMCYGALTDCCHALLRLPPSNRTHPP